MRYLDEKSGSRFPFQVLAPPSSGCGLSTTIPNANRNYMKHFIITSKTIAILSFAIGTILFILQLYRFNSGNLIHTGIIFIMSAVIINTISLLVLLFGLLGNTDKLEILKTIGIVLANIPIAIIYFYLLINFL